MKIILGLILVFVFCSAALGQAKENVAQPAPTSHGDQITKDIKQNPDRKRFVYTDIINFNEAYQKSKKDGTPLNLQRDYIEKGSPGLKIFIEKYPMTASDIEKAIEKYPDVYDSAKTLIPLLESFEPLFLEEFKKFQRIYPQAVFPPVYFLIGDNRGINSASKDGLLIEIEGFKDGDQLRRSSTLVHELAHFQQVKNVGLTKYLSIYGKEKSLLALMIREGIAEFFADLTTGRYSQEPTRAYVEKNEKQLWELLKKDVWGKETKDWMFKKPSDPNQPKDVGYVIGARIVESFYNNHPDKQEAIKKILSVTDYSEFLAQSRYEDKFKSPATQN